MLKSSAKTFEVELRTNADAPGKRLEFADMQPNSLVAHAAKHALEPKEGFFRVEIDKGREHLVERVLMVQALRNLAEILAKLGGVAALRQASECFLRPRSTWPSDPVAAAINQELGVKIGKQLDEAPRHRSCEMRSELMRRIAEDGFTFVENEIQLQFLAIPGMREVVDRYSEAAQEATCKAGIEPRYVVYSEEGMKKQGFLDVRGTGVVAARAGQRVLFTCYRNIKGKTPQERFLHERDATIKRVENGRYLLEYAGYYSRSAWVHP